MLLRLSLAAALFSALLLPQAAPGAEQEPPLEVGTVGDLSVSPAAIRLGGANRAQQLRVVASGHHLTWDATHYASLEVADPAVARLDESRLVAVADGSTELVVRLGSAQTRVRVEVDRAEQFPPLHFDNDIMPLFSKLGCNSGGCHGKQAGQNGFQLSVFGYDPPADFSALVHQARGRRLFPAAPEQSLLVRKATGSTPHGGGTRCAADSLDAQLLIEWIRQGAPWGEDDAPQLVGLEIEPAELITRRSAEHQALVTAVYSDGSRRDVTAAAGYSGNADMVATADLGGRIQTGQRAGEAAITVSYRGLVGAVRIIVPRDALTPVDLPPADHRIDELVWTKLEKMGLTPSPLCDDATFLRRLYLDTIGTLPDVDEVRLFLSDSDPHKRRAAVDRLLERPEYADFWALQWSDILLVDRNQLGDRGAYQFHAWLREQFAGNRPYDQWVRDLILASGDSGQYGPVNFYRALRTPEDLTRSVSQALLGVRLDCAQCHHHPFEKWAQEDFYGLAGFFNGLERAATTGGAELVYHQGYQQARLPLTDRAIEVRPPDGPPLAPPVDGDPRRFLADWLTSQENPWFSRVLVNRLWKHFLGRGLVEPEDDLRTTNPAVNQPLLAYLAEQFQQSGFDQKQIIRLIVTSRVYQLSSGTNEQNYDDEQNFSHYYVKRLQAEVLLDAISQVTGAPEQFPGMPPGVRSIQLWNNRLPSYFLETFGRSTRESPCQCAKSSDPTMAQALHLMNAPEIDAKIRASEGRVARLIESGRSEEQLVEELCLAALGRPPGDKEQAAAHQLFADSASRRAAAEDFLWTLLNSYEFVFVQ